VTYTLSREAEKDIIKIFVHGVEEFGLLQAEMYHQKLEISFNFLAENPLAAPLREEISPPVRIHPVGAHIVIYRVEPNDIVFIIRVRHHYENWLAE